MWSKRFKGARIATTLVVVLSATTVGTALRPATASPAHEAIASTARNVAASTPSMNAVIRFFAAMSPSQRQRLDRLGYAGRLGASTPTQIRVEGAVGAWYGSLTPRGVQDVKEAGYTGRLGA
jgi:hypothetical protein